MARSSRTLPAIGAALLLSVVSLTAGVADAPPAGATTETAGDDDELRSALADTAVMHIDLTGNISCSGGTFTRASGTPALTIDGHGFTVNMATCIAPVQVLVDAANAPLTLTHVRMTGGNSTGAGIVGTGGVQAVGPVVLDHTAITGNTTTNTGTGSSSVGGGGVFSQGTVDLISSTVANNTLTCALCFAEGGGIYSNSAVSLTSSTVTDNTTTGTGGTSGGGIRATSLTMRSSTVTTNTAAVGADINAATITSFGSVVTVPLLGGLTACAHSNPTNSFGYNYESPGNTCGFASVGDETSAAASGLVVLAENGGPTPTRLPGPGSALIDKIPNAACGSGGAAHLVTDQRDLVRPGVALGSCDIGAVEVQPPTGVSGTFTSLAPKRILDTRDGTGGLSGPFTPQQTRDLTVTGGATTVPATGVEAVVLNVTATAPSAAGWLTLFPKGAQLPTASNLNFLAGQTVPNLVVVKVGTSGQVSINNTGGNPGAGSVHVIADVVGYYTDGTLPVADGKFTPLAPNRILDTRTNVGLTGAFAPNQHRALTVTGGATTVPATASAVVMNVTATAPTAAGWLTVSPTGASFPNASNLNFLGAQTVPNLVVVKVGTGDQVDLTNTDVPTLPHPASGTVHVIADVVGYFDTTISTLIPMPPQRILDTRFGTGGVTGPVGPNAAITVDPRTATGLPPVGSYKGVIVNVTATGPTQGGWLTCYPSDAALPNASNLNFVAGQTVPNLVQIGVGPDGTFTISNTDVPTLPHPSSGTVHVIVDLVGWYQ